LTEQKTGQNRTKELAFRIAKTVLKAVLVYSLYSLVSPFVLQILALVPGLAESIEIFIIVYIMLMILGDLTERTIYQCFFNAARALFVIAYLVFSIGDGMLNTSFEGFNLTVDLTMFYTMTVLLSLLGLAKAVMQGIYFMSERAETGTKP
jgi:hypothetical protein